MTRIPMNRVVGAGALIGLWVLLVGELTLGNVLAGLAVAALAFVLFPRRTGDPAERHRFSALGVVLLLVHLAVQLVLSSVRVSLAVLAPTPARLRTAVVRVPLRTDSELVATVTADLITLTPGTLTLDVRSEPARLLVHALGVADPAEIVASVQDLERRVLRAVRPRSVSAPPRPGGPST